MEKSNRDILSDKTEIQGTTWQSMKAAVMHDDYMEQVGYIGLSPEDQVLL